MANATADTTEKTPIQLLGGNLDQMFLIFMGCLIFCKCYVVMLFWY